MSKEFKAIIVDDEPHARELMRLKVEDHCPEVRLVAMCSNCEEAYEEIERHRPSILFLDIEMPGENGMNFLKRLPDYSFYPVLVTSHAQYTLEAIKQQAFDYLLKPVDPEELKKCIGRIKKDPRKIYNSDLSDGYARLELSSIREVIFLDQHFIVHVQAAGSYSEVFTTEESYIVSKNLKSIESQLNPDVFYRVHNSHIVNLYMVEKIVHEGNYIVLKDKSDIPLSPSRKNRLISSIRTLR